MKKIQLKLWLLIAGLAGVVGPVCSQVSIVLNKPMSFQVRVPDLFTGMLINTDHITYRMYLVGTVINTRTGQKVVEARTPAQDYAPGSKTLNEASLSPAYSYGSAAVQQTGVLPYGTYEICLKAYAAQDNEEKGSGCVDEEVTPLSPPILINPDNGSTVATPYPLLIWLPPTPMSSGIRVWYDLKLTELMPNQTAYDAIQRNFAILDSKDIGTTSLQYPANAMGLQEGKTYVWQVTARSDQYVIGQTEVWTFRMETPKPDTYSKTNDSYIIIDNTIPDNIYRVHDRQIFLLFKERYQEGQLTFKVRKENEEEMTDCAAHVNSQVGENKYTIDLGSCSGIASGKVYRLTIFNTNKQIGELKFINQ
jgi:hypothetical protein